MPACPACKNVRDARCSSTEPELGSEDPLARRCPGDAPDAYEDLADVRVVAVVFTGRGSRMRALLPYLRRDLRAHQGILDRIIFALVRVLNADSTFCFIQSDGPLVSLLVVIVSAEDQILGH